MNRHASSLSATHAKKNAKYISTKKRVTAERLDALHDAGGDVSAYMDTARATRPGRVVQRVNVDFPLDLLSAIDREARRIGVTRQAFIKLRLADAIPE